MKIPRLSSLSLLRRCLVRSRWMGQAAGDLAGLLLPWQERRHFACLAPEIRVTWQHGTALPGPLHWYRTRRALVFPQLPPSAFLDFSLENLPADEWQQRHVLQLELLEEVSRRGYVMMDFIRGNFAFWDGRLVIADPGCLFPKHSLWEPTRRISVHLFQSFLLRDYQRSFVKTTFLPADAAQKAEMARFALEYGWRMRRLLSSSCG